MLETFNDYMHQVQTEYLINKEWRLGQTYFNILLAYRPDLAERIRGGLIDPYCREPFELHEFLLWVEESW